LWGMGRPFWGDLAMAMRLPLPPITSSGHWLQRLFTAILVTALSVVALPVVAHAQLKTAAVIRQGDGVGYRTEGVVEAVNHAELSAEVPGRVTQIAVKAGDKVSAGTALVMIDARAALDQQAAARAELDAAQREYARSRELFEQEFISKTAMDRAESRYRVARAQANVAGTQKDFHRLAAPYNGVVADVLVEVGDMAQPGRALVNFYDPAALRVVAQVPESVATAIQHNQPATIELAGGKTSLVGASISVLPTVNPVTHTREVRVAISNASSQDSKEARVIPGAFVRVTLPMAAEQNAPLVIPARAVITRVEFNGVYVVDAKGRAQLRQVRLGQRRGDNIEILAGVSEGERIALDPLVALRATSTQKGGAHE